MPLFGSKDTSTAQDPQIREFQRIINTEAKSDQKTLNHAVKDLKNAESGHNKGIKAADKAQHSLEQAVKDEHKTADALNKAQHKHENALSEQTSAQKTLELKQQHEQKLEQSLEQRRQAMEAMQQRKDANDQRRQAKLADLHAQANQAAVNIANDMHAGNGHSNGNAPIGESVDANAIDNQPGGGTGAAA